MSQETPAAPAESKASAAPAAPAVSAPKVAKSPFEVEQEKKKLMASTEEALNSRFSDMYKAFQYLDLDRSGRLNKKELSRAMDMWNIPINDEGLDLILGECDQDNDGGISYEEFVDKLARGTVANAAMGKRGMQSFEAMGVDGQEFLAKALGHGNVKKYDVSINSGLRA